MKATSNRQKSTLLRDAAAKLKGPAKKRIEPFLRQFYDQISVPDLIERGPADMAGAAQSVWEFIATRKPGQAKVRVHNPRGGKDLWESAHTVLETHTDDMPFLVDSVSAELARRGLTVHLVVHPVISVRRDKAGKLKELLPRGATDTDVLHESVMSFEISQHQDSADLKEIEDAIRGVISDVRAAVEDWRTMRGRVLEIIDELRARYATKASAEIAEAQDFLQWLHDDHFTFLGYRDYRFRGGGAKSRVSVDKDSGLGILRDPHRRVFYELRHLDEMPPDVRRFMRRSDPVVVSKADARSTIHRPVQLDAIGVKRFDKNGKVVGERLIVGLFTSVAYSSSPRTIPFLRRKVDKTVARAGLPAAGHAGKALTHILETYPRDELFQIKDDDLMEIAVGILQLQERQRVALFARQDDFDRFVSCLVFVPRDRFTTALRLKIQDILCDAFNGEVATYNTELGDSPLARLHVIVTTPRGKTVHYDKEALEAQIAEATRSWTDNLFEVLTDAFGEERGEALYEVYGDAFPPGYAARFEASNALDDIHLVEQVMAQETFNLDLYRVEGQAANEVRFKVLHPGEPLPLSDVLPILEDFGLKVIDEIPHVLSPTHDEEHIVMLHDFGLVARYLDKLDIDACRDNFHEAFRRVWNGEMESDGFSALVLSAGLTWREVTLIRAFAKYLRQAAAPFSQEYMETALRNNPAIAEKIVRLFQAKFDPAEQKGHNHRVISLRQGILDALEAVDSADEDRVIRRFFNLVEAALRTSYYQYDAEGQVKSTLAIKYDSRAIDELPLPRPLREIFVYSPRFEAIHLRGGMVARGGLRWSDRPEDFRTEILGLMKAQMVKNTVIVPVGSKGGFILKRPPADGSREALMEEGIACYKQFMGALLDLTDNIKAGHIVPPKQLVRIDGDDPYLVVAADKGTATFSDIANGVAIDHGFWLGDAYASGGSVGYDHKKMGITAKGAWESVKRHFRELGKDIQADDFTCVGVGDMSGDVFGNGMMLSKHTKLIAAFNHLHIFIDPDPDPAASFAERKRLFGLARSSWSDYNAKLISKGGGIYERRAKSISLSPEARAALGISKSQMTPNELIQSILKAEVELLFFGGIGTYIKSSDETNAEVGDRANDGVRINGEDVRAKVVGEGANLGCTQLGRIEYALSGGRLNTDFIDNSAGVDCSDHEVNIKILLDSVVAKGKLTRPQRNKLLETMTDEVGNLVLRDNYVQSQGMSMIEARGAGLLDVQIRLIRTLEREIDLNRTVEFLPDDETLAERDRANIGLTRPEIAVVFCYAKLWMYDELLESDLPDVDELHEDLIDYFPTALRAKYETEIGAHQLRRELVATIVTNEVLNRVGGSFVVNLMEKTGSSPADIARAFLAVRDAFGINDLWRDIEALDNKIGAEMQMTLMLDINTFIERATLWLLRNVPQPVDLGDFQTEFAKPIQALAGEIEKLLPEGVTSRVNFRVDRYANQGVPRPLAHRVAYLLLLVSALDIIRTAQASKQPTERVAKLYFEVGEQFGLGWLRYQAEKLPADSHWQKLAADAVIEELYNHQKGITFNIVTQTNGARNGAAGALEAWSKGNGQAMDQTKQMLTELESAEPVDLSMLAVASRHLAALAQKR